MIPELLFASMLILLILALLSKIGLGLQLSLLAPLIAIVAILIYAWCMWNVWMGRRELGFRDKILMTIVSFMPPILGAAYYYAFSYLPYREIRSSDALRVLREYPPRLMIKFGFRSLWMEKEVARRIREIESELKDVSAIMTRRRFDLRMIVGVRGERAEEFVERVRRVCEMMGIEVQELTT